MAFGDAWGHDGRTYDGKEMRQLVEALTGGLTGVTSRDALQVLQQVSPANTVRVAAGEIIVAATGSGLFGAYEIPNDADLSSPAFGSTGAQARTDRLIVRSTGGVAALEIVVGTPGAGTPAPPAVTGDNWEYLARVEIPASTSTILQAYIKDERRLVGPPISHFASTGLPSTPMVGQVNYEPDTKLHKFWDGTSWLLPFGVAWGIVGTPQGFTASGSSLATGAGSDFTRTITTRSDRNYKVHLHTRVSPSNTSEWEIAANTSDLESLRMDNIDAQTGMDNLLTSSAVLWQPTSGSKTIAVAVTRNAGTGTIQFLATAASKRWFWVEDVGPR
jgi:hypothetical protein